MSIVPLKKITLYGLARQRDEVITGLQQLGCVHLLNLHDQKLPKPVERPEQSEVHAALKYLESSPVQRREAKRSRGFDAQKLAAEVLDIQKQRQALNDERDHLVRSIETLQPWGDFQIPSNGTLGELKLWFYPIRHHQLADVRKLDVPWRVVSQDHQNIYVVVISKERPEGMPGKNVELDARSLSTLRHRLDEVEEQLDALYWERAALTRWTTLMRQETDAADDAHLREVATQHVLDTGEVFALQGWVPKVAVRAVGDFANQRHLAITIEEPTDEEHPPTLLKNPDTVAGAEGAVTFYITPSYHAWDPSLIMFFSFSLFFAMIMSDAGYAFLLGLLVFFMWKKLSASQGAIRFRNLLIALIVASIGYGIVLGSYFGVSPPADSFLGQLQIRLDGKQLMDDANRNFMMFVAVTIGILHLTLANLVTAWRNRGSFHALSSVGWMAVLLGGLAFGVASLPEPNPFMPWLVETLNQPYDSVKFVLTEGAKYSLIGGLVAVLLFSSTRALISDKPLDYLFRFLEGLQGLTKVSQAFGDVLSYLRLFALGLASAQLASTFNNLAEEATAIPGPGILLAVLIVLVGHGINILLGIMSGVVHGLRLNCIEFFNWSLSEEGYPFRAFCKKAGC